MVRIIVNHQRSNRRCCELNRIVRTVRILLISFVVVGIMITIASILLLFKTQERLRGGVEGGAHSNNNPAAAKQQLSERDYKNSVSSNNGVISSISIADGDSNAITNNDVRYQSCPYMKITDLTPAERYPKQFENHRHIVQPPRDGNITLVCCHTTVGPWNILVHTNWAPIGAQRFLDMVISKYFDTSVPLMRCMKDFICQFGLNGIPAAMKRFQRTMLLDDPNWLPEGPKYRVDSLTKIRRFNRGYMAYAGAGKNSRDIQLIVALADNGPLGGGSPWEVPFGEMVGNHSYTTLGKIYTGYDEHGPSQGLLHKADALTIVKEKYPLIDYVQSCFIVDQYR